MLAHRVRHRRKQYKSDLPELTLRLLPLIAVSAVGVPNRLDVLGGILVLDLLTHDTNDGQPVYF